MKTEDFSCASLFTGKLISFFFKFLPDRASGLGEHIIIKGGARNVTEYLANNSLDNDDKNSFLENLYRYSDGRILEFGFLSVCIFKGDFQASGADVIEIFASHSTPSFIYGWKLSGKSVEMDISRLRDKKFKSFATCLQIKP